MNAIQTYRDWAKTLTVALVPENMADTRRHLADAIAIYENNDDFDREQTVEAIIAGRPAFWTMATYHDQWGCNVLRRINEGMSVVEAIAKYPKLDHGRLLGTLIPLNAKAETELFHAYASQCGLIRDEFELARRRVVNSKTRAA